LFQQGGGSFYVFRSKTPRELPEPIGALSGLMVEAMAAEPVALEVKQPEPSMPPPGYKDSEFPTQNGVAPPAPGSAPIAPIAPSAAVGSVVSPRPAALEAQHDRAINQLALTTDTGQRRIVVIAS